MAIIVDGRLMAFFLAIITFGLFYAMMYLGKHGREVKVRALPAMNAIPEAIGRAAEMGRPVFYTTGTAGLQLVNAAQGPQTLASISIMEHVARLCAKNGVRLDLFTPIPDALPLMQETLSNSYHLEGSTIEFNTDQIHFVPEYDPYVAASLGYLQRNRPASSLLMGGFSSEAVILGEAGNVIGAMQIAGTANTGQIPFLVATCDYVLISEELYAASASVSQNPDVLGSLQGEDYLKIGLVVLTIVGFLLALFGNSWLVGILKV
jgi:hypothetical protein